jgi:hypothetical protein
MSRDNETPEEAFERNLHRLQTEGLDAAVEASLDLLRDGKAPSQAKSATINAVYRASGLFNRRDDDKEPEPAKKTSEELGREIAQLEAHLVKAAKGETDDESDGGIFG